MKKTAFILSIFFVSYFSNAQNILEKFNYIQIQTLNGIELQLTSVLKHKHDKPVILFTWSKAWCYPCAKALIRFNSEYYKELRADYGLKFIALNLDQNTGVDEIKEYVMNKNWYFDIYMDLNKNFMSKLNVRGAPETYLIINNKIIEYKNGFIEGTSNPGPNADYIYNMIKSLGNKIIYYDENWDYTVKANASYVRYIDHLNGFYEVSDRWISGELQMKGKFADKWQKEPEGEFTYFYKNGNKESQRSYKNNLVNGYSSQWFENGKLWVKEEYRNGKLFNILQLYDKNENTLYKGSLFNGKGYIYRYDKNGTKTSKQEYIDGQLDGIYTVYDSEGKIKSKHIYKSGEYVKKLQ